MRTTATVIPMKIQKKMEQQQGVLNILGFCLLNFQEQYQQYSLSQLICMMGFFPEQEKVKSHCVVYPTNRFNTYGSNKLSGMTSINLTRNVWRNCKGILKLCVFLFVPETEHCLKFSNKSKIKSMRTKYPL